MPDDTPGRRPTEWDVLDFLLDDDERPKLVKEIVREIGSVVAVADALDVLHRSGIIHHIDDFVFVTNSCARFNHIKR
jgi:hypothetical protein